MRSVRLLVVLSLAYLASGNEFDQFPYINREYRPRKLCSDNVCGSLEPTRIRCSSSGCTKRALQEDVGPFWANRGKKDPAYRQETLYAEEPHWVLVRRAQDHLQPFTYDFDPFFVTRGKKDRREEKKRFNEMHLWNNQETGKE